MTNCTQFFNRPSVEHDCGNANDTPPEQTVRTVIPVAKKPAATIEGDFEIGTGVARTQRHTRNRQIEKRLDVFRIRNCGPSFFIEAEPALKRQKPFKIDGSQFPIESIKFSAASNAL